MVPFDGYVCPVNVRQFHIPTYPEYGVSVVVVEILDCVTKMFYVCFLTRRWSIHTSDDNWKFLLRCNFAKTASDVVLMSTESIIKSFLMASRTPP